jgi:tRNA nucleotidyltransferase (CCA-adding enzyme)
MGVMERLGDVVLERLAELPAGSRLLAALDGLAGVHVVGGAVRDLLLGSATPRDIDLVAEGDGASVARAVASALGGRVVEHGRFGTATLEGEGVNVATARAESYGRPGALPEVRPGSLADDMARRDFTVNAIAVGLSPDRRGVVHCDARSSDDLDARLLRVLHEQSFVDDPTRLVRLARYAARLGFEVEQRTAELARAAFAAGAPATAGRARMGNELMLLLREPEPIGALVVLRTLAGDAPLDPGLEVDETLLQRVAALLPGDAFALLAALTRSVPRDRLTAWLADAHVSEAPAVLDAVAAPDRLAHEMASAQRPSEQWRLLRRRSPQAVALAGAVEGRATAVARAWLGTLRHARLQIGGDDLLHAGVPEGPEIGARLEAALMRKLDGEVASREEELAAALDAQV